MVARSTTMQVRNLDFVAAAWCAGCSRFRILAREVLPNIASHLVVVATLEMALAILLEAALSFLGLGVPPPLPSWGLMIAEAKDYMFFSPWVIMIPAWRCSCWCSASTCWATGCATCSARGPTRERAARGRRARGRLRRPHLGRPRRLAHRRARRDPLPGGRIGLRQVGDGARRHEPAGARRRRSAKRLAFEGQDLLGLSDRAWRGCAATAWR